MRLGYTGLRPSLALFCRATDDQHFLLAPDACTLFLHHLTSFASHFVFLGHSTDRHSYVGYIVFGQSNQGLIELQHHFEFCGSNWRSRFEH